MSEQTNYDELAYKCEVEIGIAKNLIVKVPLSLIEQAEENNQAIEVVTPEGRMYITPFDFPNTAELDSLDYASAEFEFKPTEEKNVNKESLSKWELQLLDKFHWSWFNLLREPLNSAAFKSILKRLKQLRGEGDVYPAQEDMFLPFSYPLGEYERIVVNQSPFQSEFEHVTDLKELYRKLAFNHTFWLHVHFTETVNAEGNHSHEMWEEFIELIVPLFPSRLKWLVCGIGAEYVLDFLPENALHLELTSSLTPYEFGTLNEILS